VWKHPPGDEIYRKGPISVFEVDGKKNKVDLLPGLLIITYQSKSVHIFISLAFFLFADLLPKPVSTCQTLPGPQNTVL